MRKVGTRPWRARPGAFLDLAFDRNSGCFRMGTTPEGVMRGVEAVALDTQLWPLIALVGSTAGMEECPDLRRTPAGRGGRV